MATYLDRILARHREAAGADRRPVGQLVEAALDAPAPRGFAAAISDRAGDGVAVVAEIKRRSPSRGALDEGLDPARAARDYESGGAACLSVLTDGEFFGGSPEDLRAARAGCSLPVLRKDFTVSEQDVADTRIMGADAVLLIAAALSDGELAAFHGLARRLGLDALVEVHDEAEVDRALAAGATLVGVNQRDLYSFEVDRERAGRLRPRIPPGVVAVAESGIASPEDAARLAGAGYDAVLVGEWLVRSGDRASAVASLRSVPSPSSCL
ncbi:MAG: indole-3-glycerol phosphate synthase TrpC [Acidimicrobiales bacterium]